MVEILNHPATWTIAGIALITVFLKTGMWIGSVNVDRENFTSFMDEIRTDIKEILHRLPSKAVASGSPLMLTSFGHKISTRLGSDSIAADLVPMMRKLTKDKLDYDIQNLCFKYVKEDWLPSEDIEILIKKAAYENGTERDQVLDVIAIELRDALLAS